jgi:catechol 2,3-dioxygenase-like lactoylglutathione lyase family enzyme
MIGREGTGSAGDALDDRTKRGAQKMELHRGRLIDHIQLVVKDLDASRRFYGALADVLGVPVVDAGQGFFWMDEFVVSSTDSPAAQGKPTGRQHIAFQAKDRATVDAFHKAGLAGGGKDNGAPGKRPYHPGYYAAFLLDPDGNNIEAVYHGPHERSSASVKITFDMPG